MTEHKIIEYSIKPPGDYKKLVGRRGRLITLYSAMVLGFLLIPIITLNAMLVPVVLIVGGAICYFAIWCTWPKTKPEYDYSMIGGVFTLAVIYGGRVRRQIIEIELSKAEFIGPLNGVYNGKLRDFGAEEEIRGTFTDEQANYFILYRDENEKRRVIYINAGEEAVKVMRRCNGRTVTR